MNFYAVYQMVWFNMALDDP